MKKEKNKIDEKSLNKIFLKTLKRSRKAYLVEYACGLFLIFLLTITFVKGIRMSVNFKYFIFGLAMFSFVSVEASRIFVRYKITSKKVVIIKGLIKQNRKNVYFHPLGFVPDIDVKQDRTQRLLNYGTIYVKGSGGDNSFEIKDVNRPHRIMNIIETLVDQNKHQEKTSKK